MKTPIRIQRKRTKGFKMPENTVYVGRPSKWGNPFKVGLNQNSFGSIFNKKECDPNFYKKSADVKHCVSRFEPYIHYMIKSGQLNISELKGKNLACWCKIGEPCHADILLKLANK